MSDLSQTGGSICAAGRCDWCGCTFRKPTDVMYHRCAAMQEAHRAIKDGLPVTAPNQHDDAVNAASTRAVLLSALDYWEKSGCDCCSPTIADDAIEMIGPDVALWGRMRKFGIELAQTAQNVIDDEEAEPDA